MVDAGTLTSTAHTVPSDQPAAVSGPARPLGAVLHGGPVPLLRGRTGSTQAAAPASQARPPGAVPLWVRTAGGDARSHPAPWLQPRLTYQT